MDFSAWNEELGSAFLDEGPGRPVYFAVTEPELRYLNDQRNLGMDDPVADLRRALRLYSFRNFGELHRRWERERSFDLPPWLPLLAATTIVVDQQTEKGSTAFYPPLSAFLGTSRIGQDDYEETFGRWWRALKRWLEDEDRQAGRRGFATWGSIPQRGPRCVIGHPYTQVLLRREERVQIEEFIAEFEHDGSAPPVARDREKVALNIVSAFRRWARHRRAVSPRLRRILEKGEADESLSLGYVLLGRLFDEISGEKRTSGPGSAVRIVPAYDGYEREARLVAMGPSWVKAREPISIPGAVAPLYEPGETVAIDRPISSAVLEEGLELQHETVARLTPRDRYILAARDFDLWCEVEGAVPGEELHMLMRSSEAESSGLKAVPTVSGLPDGWVICGPLTLDDLPAAVLAAATASGRRLTPRLVGGLQLQPRVYLTGGEPTLELPEDVGALTIDGVTHKPTADTLRLSELGLSPGTHTADIDGFELTFESISSLAPIDSRPALGRNLSGVVVGFNQRSDDSVLVTGARRYPTVEQPQDPHMFPHHHEFVKFGAPGQVAVLRDLALATWAKTSGLPHLAIELYARSTYPNGDRVITYPWWIAWQEGSGAWTVAELPGNRPLANEGAPTDLEAWSRLCQRIGTTPHIWRGRPDVEDETAVLVRWQQYATTGVDRV